MEAMPRATRMKFLCIDTCIFVGCALVEHEGDVGIREALEALEEKLTNNEVVLLLPEVIKLEFPKVLARGIKDVNDAVALHKTGQEIKGKQKLKPAMLDRLHRKIDEFVQDTTTGTATANEVIQRIFAHGNTRLIPVTSDLIAEAYKMTLEGRKPWSDGLKSPIHADCVIIASLVDALNAETDYDLFLCTTNTSDFAASSDVNNPLIHPDIATLFSSITLYTNLLTFLNNELGTTYPAELIERLTEESYSKAPAAPAAHDTLSASETTSSMDGSVGSVSGPESAENTI